MEKYQDLALEIKRIHRAMSVSNTHCDWRTWNSLEECKGLAWDVESARRFWKCAVVSHPWCCSYLEERSLSLSCRIAAETWLKIPRKELGKIS